ncbi:MAG: cell envelope integrity protein TolA [Planctomycetes bacterium]|nr:cell envelope integrity protein TolA [Planctomycetota bacterium]
MEKLSKTWKWVIIVTVVVGVLIVIDIYLDRIKRAPRNEHAVSTERLDRSEAELRDQDEAAQQKLYDLRDKIKRKVDAWNQGVESDWDVYRKEVVEIERAAEGEYAAVRKGEEEARAKVRTELAKVEAQWRAKAASADLLTSEGTAILSAADAERRLAENELHVKLGEIKTKANVEREAIVAKIKARIKDWSAANSRYTLAKFYEFFGRPNRWVPTEHGTRFYYKYRDGSVLLVLSDGSPSRGKYEVFRPISIWWSSSVDEAYSIPISLRLAREGSFRPLNDKTPSEIKRLVSDWTFDNLQSKEETKSSKKPIEAFYNVFGEPKYLEVHRDYYSLYYECKIREREYSEPHLAKNGKITMHRKGGELKDGIVELQMPRRDFDERGTVNVEIRSVFEPGKLADSINKIQLKVN